jgi:probable rRNA maturation factor
MSPKDSPLLIRQLSRRFSRRPMREFLDEITRRVTRGRGVVCLITDDRELRRLNRQFRGRNYATDVLSFPAGDGWGMDPRPDGRGLTGTRALTGAPQDQVVKNARPNGRASGDGRASKDERASLGEIAISIDRAAAQAAEHGHSLDDELQILMLHGVLHLAGFDHERDSGEMRRAETRWRKRLGLPTGLIERARDEHTPVERTLVKRTLVKRTLVKRTLVKRQAEGARR